MNNTKWGYARVSTKDQDLTIQQEQLKKLGVKKIFSEKTSGAARFQDRAEFSKLLKQVKAGDEIFVTKLDRLSRKLSETLKIIELLEEKKVVITSLEQGISTKGEMGKLVISIIVAVAEMERSRILERTAEGRARRKKEGKPFGRSRKFNYSAIQEFKRKGMSNKEISETFKVSLSNLTYILKKEL